MKAPCGDAACGEDAGLSLRTHSCLLPGPQCSSRIVFHTGSVLRNTSLKCKESVVQGWGATMRQAPQQPSTYQGMGLPRSLLFQELCSAKGGYAACSLSLLHTGHAWC